MAHANFERIINNPDWPIYFPDKGAGEFAVLSLNVYRTCSNHCRYCYVPQFTRMEREAFYNQVIPKRNLLLSLEEQCKALHGFNCPPIELCFLCDPYQEADKEGLTRRVLEILKKHGLNFMILSKNGTNGCKDFDLYDNGDLFGQTLTFLDNERSKLWEPNAALPDDRAEALIQSHNKGIRNWVSLEPTIDPEETLSIIKLTHEFVDEYKVGKLNHVGEDNGVDLVGIPETEVARIKAINWKDFGFRAVELLEKLGKSYYIKRDLRCEMFGTTYREELQKDLARKKQ